MPQKRYSTIEWPLQNISLKSGLFFDGFFSPMFSLKLDFVSDFTEKVPQR